ncbi:LysE family translocator [Arthrobacter sp. CAU 1506]|uniref:LysE family translocator n=1 Tax=Arthrobacter sp. CAU 1506 TaxID=2560052 RepID=UPI0010AD15D1|nr:LysE family translocator [Arthrobacter sp. CAU 1506]TJY72557.1 LysE family translocator [Arthrobacter sp. CAU 1506]
MDVSLLVQFWVVALLLALTPGADWAYAIGAGLRAPSVIPSVLGMAFGYLIVVCVVAVGVGALVTEYPMALTVLTIVGSAYLIYLGVNTLTSKPGAATASEAPLDSAAAAQFFRGAGVSGINPKGLLLLLALLPQFTSPTGWPSAAQMLVLGGLHVVNCLYIYFAVALLARRILRSQPRASAIVTRASGVIMVLIGLGILVEKAAELL